MSDQLPAATYTERATLPAETPQSGTPEWYATLATPKQMNWVRQGAARWGLDADAECRRMYGVPVDGLTKSQAYEIITRSLRGTRRRAVAKRVVFTFDERSYESLVAMKVTGGYQSLAQAVRDSLQITRALQSQIEAGYTELIVRNPQTSAERVIVIPELRGQR